MKIKKNPWKNTVVSYLLKVEGFPQNIATLWGELDKYSKRASVYGIKS